MQTLYTLMVSAQGRTARELSEMQVALLEQSERSEKMKLQIHLSGTPSSDALSQPTAEDFCEEFVQHNSNSIAKLFVGGKIISEYYGEKHEAQNSEA